MPTNKELLEKAQALNNEEKYSEVIELLADDLLKERIDADLYAEKAQAYYRLDEKDLCEKAVEKALKINPNQAKANHYKGGIYVDLKKYDEAIKYFNKAIECDPKFAYPYSGLGIVYSDLDEYDKAIKYYNKAIELDPKFAYPYNGLGDVYYVLKEYDNAIKNYNESIKLDPKVAYSYSGLGDVYYVLKEYDKAIENHNKAIELDPKEALFYNDLGNVYSDLKEYDKSIENHSKAIELDPKNAVFFNDLGNVYSDLKEYDKAVENYNKSIKLDPKDAYSFNKLGDVYHYLGKYDNAIENHNEAIELDPKEALFYNDLGNVYSDLKEYDKAIENYDKAIKLDPENAFFYNDLGNVYSDLKEYDKAIENYTKSIKLDPENALHYNGLGDIYFDLEEYDEAIENFNRSIELDPKNEIPYYQRALIYSFKAKYRNALNDFEKYIEVTENKSDYFALQAKSEIEELKKSLAIPEYGSIRQLVEKIKDILLLKDSSVTHYTSLTAAKAMILDDSKFRLSECAFLNDPSEGRELFKFLGISEAPIRKSEENCAMPFTRKPFIGSFVSDVKHDDLTLWRMYGKESKEEAKGCSITIDSEKLEDSLIDFLSSRVKTDSREVKSDDFNFYRMAYKTQNKENLFVVPGAKDEEKELNTCMNQLAEKVKEYIANVKKKSYSIKDLLELLNSIAYLFKSAEYQYEHEIRMVVNGVGLEKKIISDNNQLRIYVETVPINPIIQKITLGPKVERAEEWAAAFYYKLDKQGLHPEIFISHLPFK
ncbi:MAG: tetratricopeptide repeat protein [Bacteroidales bacterium]|nr:tetratricopeptide repeat protein [Bacteroidales bacterium]